MLLPKTKLISSCPFFPYQQLGVVCRPNVDLRSDVCVAQFSLCLDDLSRLALRKYTQALSKQIGQAETNPNGSVTNTGSNTLMEKLFNLFMDHGTSWSESLESTLAEAQTPSTPQVSEGSIHR